MRTATCACGQLIVKCMEDPAKVSLCHCRQCQKRTGSAFGIAAFFSKGSAIINGSTSSFTRRSDTGYTITFHFCPKCGSTVYWEPERKPGMLAIAVGAFADPDFPQPENMAFPEHRHSWLKDGTFE